MALLQGFGTAKCQSLNHFRYIPKLTQDLVFGQRERVLLCKYRYYWALFFYKSGKKISIKNSKMAQFIAFEIDETNPIFC